jgi:hypothetical protein
MQVSSLEGLVGIILNKISKKNWTGELDLLMHTIHTVEKDLGHLPGNQKKNIVTQALQNLQTTELFSRMPIKDRQNFNKMLECLDSSIDLLVAAMNSRAFKKFRKSCFFRGSTSKNPKV